MGFGFLKNLRAMFAGCINRKTKSKDFVEDTEVIGRYLFSSSDFNKNTNNFKKHTRLMPLYEEKTGRYETSVYRLSYMENDNQMWSIGDKFAGSPRDDARAIVKLLASIIRGQDLQLNVVSTKEPHDLHADIINWPTEKQKQMLKAKLLKSKIDLIVR